METFSIELSIQEANVILGALGQLPFAQVHGLIRNIQDQANAQLNGTETLEASPIETPEPEKELA
jgi:hypothetical protein